VQSLILTLRRNNKGILLISKTRIALALPLLLITIIALTSSLTLAGSLLKVTVVTDQTLYTYRAKVQVKENLTLSGTPVNGLVGIEVNSLNVSYESSYAHMVARTVGTLPPNLGYNITIVSVKTTNSNGTLKTSFTRGTTAYINVTVINHSAYERPVLITVLAADSDSTPITSEVLSYFQTPLAGGGEISYTAQFYIDTWVSPGPAMLYANTYSNWPSVGGFPYTAEKKFNFTILRGGAPASTVSNQQIDTASAPAIQSTGVYNVSFRLPPYAPQGLYSVNATAWSQEFSANASTEFTLARQMLGDINFDHRINILDVVAVTTIYGASSGSANWNPQCDVHPDGVINILDIVVVTSKYGETY
jgi:hypothetical protein